MKYEDAYKLGYVDGYEEGVEENPYHHINQRVNFLQYLKGYDEGVAEYCKEDEFEGITLIEKENK